MGTTHQEHWEKQFDSELISVLRSEGSGLVNYIRKGTLRGASQIEWKVLGSSTSTKNRPAKTKKQFADIVHSTVVGTLNNYEQDELINYLDEFKTNANHRKGYADAFSMEFACNQETEILEAVVAGATVQTGSGYAAVDKDLLAEVRALASANNWKGRPGDWCFVITPAVEQVLLTLGEVLSKDENPNDVTFVNGKITRLYGFDVISSNELDALQTNSDATQVDCYAWNKMAVGFQMGAGEMSKVTWNNDYGSWQVSSAMSCLSKAILGNGIIKVRADTDAT